MPGHDDNFMADQALDLPVTATKEACKNATFIVTGANTGLGYEAAKHYVRLGSSKVILAVRSVAKGEEAKSKIEAETGISGVAEVWQLNLCSYASVKAFAKKVESLERVDAVVENAAVALDKWSQEDGLETTLIVNVTSTLLLAGLILPKLKESAQKFSILPHITLIGSGVAFSVPGVLEKIPQDADILDWLNDQKNGIGARYPVSKLVLFYAFREWTTLNPLSSTNVVVNYVNPGLCVTELDRHVDEKVQKTIGDMRAKFGRTAEMGSRTLLHGAMGGKDTNGQYLSECVVKANYIPEWVTNESGQKLQKRVWESVTTHVNKVVPGTL